MTGCMEVASDSRRIWGWINTWLKSLRQPHTMTHSLLVVKDVYMWWLWGHSQQPIHIHHIYTSFTVSRECAVVWGCFIEISIKYYSTRVTGWISRVGSILKWSPHWKYYGINVYISHLQIRFAYINTYRVFLSAANAIAIVSTCCSIVRVRNRSMAKTLNSFYSFLLSCQKLDSMITLLYEKLVGWRSNENTVLTPV